MTTANTNRTPQPMHKPTDTHPERTQTPKPDPNPSAPKQGPTRCRNCNQPTKRVLPQMPTQTQHQNEVKVSIAPNPWPCVINIDHEHIACETHENTDCPTIQEIKETAK